MRSGPSGGRKALTSVGSWRSAGGVGEQLFERDRLPVFVDGRVGEALADGGGPLELARLDQAGDHRGGDRRGDATEVPAVVEFERHAAVDFSLAVDRGGDDFPSTVTIAARPTSFSRGAGR